MRKRTAAILTALALLLSLGACGRNNTDSPAESAPPAAEVSAPALPEAAETETPVFGANLQGEGGGRFFSPQDIALPEEGLQFINCARAGDSIWMYDYESAQSSRLYRLDLNTLDISKIDGQWGKIETVAGDSGGSGAVLSEMEDGSRRLSLIGADGSVSALRLPELGEAYFSSLCICPGGYLLEGTDALIALDGEGQVRKRFDKNGNGLTAVHSGEKTVLASVDGEGTWIRELDDGFNVAAEYRCKDSYSSFYDAPSGVFALQGSVIYRLDYTKEKREGFVSTFASGMKPDYFIYLSDDCVFSLNAFLPALWYPSDAGDITILRLATYGDLSLVSSVVRHFNDSSDQYKIDLIDYEDFDEAGGENTGLTRLHTDIASGNAPDIFDLSVLTAAAYGEKGLLEDLRLWFDRDAALSYDQLLPEAVGLLEQEDGSLYDFVPTFGVETYCVPSALVGERESWTLEVFFTLAEEYGMQQLFGPGMTAAKFMEKVLTYDKEEFTDRKNASCSFDNERFVKLLELSGQLNGERIYGFEGALVYVGRQMLYDPLINALPLKSILTANSIYKGDVRFAGFPSDSGTGTALRPMLHLGMYSGSANKEGVWAFFKFLISDGYLGLMDEFGNYALPGLPIVTEPLAKRMELWTAEAEASVGSPITSTFGTPESMETVTIEILPYTGNMGEKLMELTGRMDTLYEYDQKLYDIVMQEAQAFYSGDKTAEQAAKLIQSKASIYMSEQFG